MVRTSITKALCVVLGMCAISACSDVTDGKMAAPRIDKQSVSGAVTNPSPDFDPGALQKLYRECIPENNASENSLDHCVDQTAHESLKKITSEKTLGGSLSKIRGEVTQISTFHESATSRHEESACINTQNGPHTLKVAVGESGKIKSFLSFENKCDDFWS